MTGIYSSLLGYAETPGSNEYNCPLDRSFLSDELQLLGYHTVLVGKWHLGNSALNIVYPQGYACKVLPTFLRVPGMGLHSSLQRIRLLFRFLHRGHWILG